MKIGSHFVFSLKIFPPFQGVWWKNALADASLERPADLIHSLISVLWLKRCDMNWLCRMCWNGFPGVLPELNHNDGGGERALPS